MSWDKKLSIVTSPSSNSVKFSSSELRNEGQEKINKQQWEADDIVFHALSPNGEKRNVETGDIKKVMLPVASSIIESKLQKVKMNKWIFT